VETLGMLSVSVADPAGGGVYRFPRCISPAR
jgi:hypothetical protein